MADVAVRPLSIRWNRDPMRDGYLLAAAVWVLAIALGFIPGGEDARAYFDARLPDPYLYDYAAGSAQNAGYFYSPVVVLALTPLQWLGWPLFAALVTGAGLLALYGILGRWAWLGLFFPPVWWDLSAGNVNTIIGFVAVAGVARPAWWAFALLTKITPGIGVLWFAVRREWRSLGVAFGVTGALVLVTLVAAPLLWFEWAGFLLRNAGSGYTGPGFFTIEWPLTYRLAAAVVILVWGARSGRAWVLPIVVTLAMPVLWYSALAPLVAVFHGRATRKTAPTEVEAVPNAYLADGGLERRRARL